MELHCHGDHVLLIRGEKEDVDVDVAAVRFDEDILLVNVLVAIRPGQRAKQRRRWRQSWVDSVDALY